jgi:hypothetical protein
MIDYGEMKGLTRCVNKLVAMKKANQLCGEDNDALKIMEEIRVVEECWVSMAQGNPVPETVDLIRVQVNPDGKFDIVDFTTARRSGRLLYHNVPQEGIPTWIVEAISMLRITDARSVVQSVGFKVNDKLYYIVDKRGENE